MTKAFALNVSMKALFFVCSGIGKRPSKLVRQPRHFIYSLLLFLSEAEKEGAQVRGELIG